jgi:CRISPR/Cas system-associated protein Csm6
MIPSKKSITLNCVIGYLPKKTVITLAGYLKSTLSKNLVYIHSSLNNTKYLPPIHTLGKKIKKFKHLLPGSSLIKKENSNPCGSLIIIFSSKIIQTQLLFF